MLDSLTSLTAAPDAAGTATAGIEISDLLPELDRLKALLEDYDGAASDLVSEIESRLAHTELVQPIRALAERIDDYEFDEALELLNDLLEAAGSSTTDSAKLT